MYISLYGGVNAKKGAAMPPQLFGGVVSGGD
jgi:hypothetical protein